MTNGCALVGGIEAIRYDDSAPFPDGGSTVAPPNGGMDDDEPIEGGVEAPQPTDAAPIFFCEQRPATAAFCSDFHRDFAAEGWVAALGPPKSTVGTDGFGEPPSPPFSAFANRETGSNVPAFLEWTNTVGTLQEGFELEAKVRVSNLSSFLQVVTTTSNGCKFTLRPNTLLVDKNALVVSHALARGVTVEEWTRVRLRGERETDQKGRLVVGVGATETMVDDVPCDMSELSEIRFGVLDGASGFVRFDDVLVTKVVD